MLIEVILILSGLLAYYYLTFKSRQRFWRERGVPQPERCPFPMGNFPGRSDKVSVNDAVLEQYREFAGHKFYGTYSAMTAKPILIVRDLDLAQRILGTSTTCIIFKC